jgi:hypothetical protein
VTDRLSHRPLTSVEDCCERWGGRCVPVREVFLGLAMGFADEAGLRPVLERLVGTGSPALTLWVRGRTYLSFGRDDEMLPPGTWGARWPTLSPTGRDAAWERGSGWLAGRGLISGGSAAASSDGRLRVEDGMRLFDATPGSAGIDSLRRELLVVREVYHLADEAAERQVRRREASLPGSVAPLSPVEAVRAEAHWLRVRDRARLERICLLLNDRLLGL